MMFDKRWTVALMAAAVLGLSGCGGGSGGFGGDDDDDDLPLAGKNDVLRELGVLDYATDFAAIASGEDATVAAAPVATAKRGPAGLAAGRLPGNIAKAQSSSQQVCSGGGNQTDTTGDKTRQFQLFAGQTVSVDFDNTTLNGCQYSETSGSTVTTTIENGVLETGESRATTGGFDYAYATAGTSSQPYRNSATSTQNGNVVSRSEYTLSGAQEQRWNGAGMEVRSNIGSRSQDTANGSTVIVELSLGTSSTPFSLYQSDSNATVTLIGPYEYESTLCGGEGETTVNTTVPLSGRRDGSNYDVVGGTLALVRGSRSVTVAFNNDGSASYTFSDGTSGTLSRSELRNQFGTHPCN